MMLQQVALLTFLLLSGGAVWMIQAFNGLHTQKLMAHNNRLGTRIPTRMSSVLKATPVSHPGGILADGGVSPCVIKVLGVGGGGGNAVMRMIETGVSGVDFLAINTDVQALAKFEGLATTLNIGKDVTRGLGAGGLPENGRKAAEESRNDIMKLVAGTDLIFITAGMGGGTGSGAAPVVAELAKEAGALTVGVVTKPFAFEGKRRMQQALASIEKFRETVDTLIIVSNDRLLHIIPENTPLQKAFSVADDVLRQGVVGISEIIIRPGLINVDFADVKSIMGNAGTALMGIGRGSGRSRATDAAAAAISSPLLDFPIENARGVVFNVVGGTDLTLQEINAAAEVIFKAVDPNANIIFGSLVDPNMEGDVAITVIATGFPEGQDPSVTVPSLSSSGGGSSSGSYNAGGGGGGGADGKFVHVSNQAKNFAASGSSSVQHQQMMQQQQQQYLQQQQPYFQPPAVKQSWFRRIFGGGSSSPQYQPYPQQQQQPGLQSGQQAIDTDFPSFIESLKRRR